VDHGNRFHLHFHDKEVERHHLHCPIDAHAQVVVAEVLVAEVHVVGGVVVEVHVVGGVVVEVLVVEVHLVGGVGVEVLLPEVHVVGGVVVEVLFPEVHVVGGVVVEVLPAEVHVVGVVADVEVVVVCVVVGFAEWAFAHDPLLHDGLPLVVLGLQNLHTSFR
jgi:hypothetical protein